MQILIRVFIYMCACYVYNYLIIHHNSSINMCVLYCALQVGYKQRKYIAINQIRKSLIPALYFTAQCQTIQMGSDTSLIGCLCHYVSCFLII